MKKEILVSVIVFLLCAIWLETWNIPYQGQQITSIDENIRENSPLVNFGTIFHNGWSNARSSFNKSWNAFSH